METRSDAVVVLKSVSFGYDKADPVLDGIDLEVFKGERLLILGRNGSGKSTLIRIMGALRTPSQGACFVCGHDTAEPSAVASIHRKLGVVFQNPESQIVGAVVEDDTAFAPENQGLPPQEIESRVVWALSKVGLLHKRTALVSALSGGEKQRLALAGALASKPICLVLDEPTAMLDPEGRAQVESVLCDLHREGTTIVQVTHHLEDVEHADRVVVLAEGNWLWQGTRDDFWKRAESFGFELPALLRLQRRVLLKGFPASPTVEGLSGALVEALSTGVVKIVETAVKSPPENLNPVNNLETRELSCCFNAGTPLETPVLKNVSCVIEKGHWLAVLGRTGSGKSTLVQHLNGLYQVQSGEIFFNGNPIPCGGRPLRELRRSVGLVFQSPEDQLFSPTVREELAFAPQNWGLSEEETQENIARAMDYVGLEERYLERNPLCLSGGERRLVAIASVLTAEPECIVLDEPTAGLDAIYRRRILELLAQLKQKGKTVVTVTHDLEMAFGCADRLLVLKDGTVAAFGQVSEVLPKFLALEDRSAWPGLLRVSEALRRLDDRIPLTWDPETLCRAFGF